MIWEGGKPFWRVRGGEACPRKNCQKTIKDGVVPLRVSLQAGCSGVRDAAEPAVLVSCPCP